MKLLIVGSRSFNDYERMKDRILSRYSIDQIDCILSGGAKGADTLARTFALNHNITYIEYPAKWNELGKQAGILRNMVMVDAADEVLAFWDGTSRGTQFTINYAKEKQRIIYVEFTEAVM
jgi:hypothetical protein